MSNENIKPEYRNIQDSEFVPLICIKDKLLGKYEINKLGNIRIINKNKIIKIIPKNSFNDYPRVVLLNGSERIYYFVHVLLAKTFLIRNYGEKLIVDHIDQNKSNYSLSNLRWVSYSENNKNKKKITKNHIKYYKFDKEGNKIDEYYQETLNSTELRKIKQSLKNNTEYNGFTYEMIDERVESYYKEIEPLTNSPEIWRKIKGLENTGWMISSYGVLKNSKGDKTIGIDSRGYRSIFINKKGYLIHRLVADTFNEKTTLTKDKIVNHIDTTKYHNFIDNLEICNDQKENMNNKLTKEKLKTTPILKYDKSGKFLKEYKSICEASKELSKKSHSTIYLAVTGAIKHAYGFIWKIKTSDDYPKNINSYLGLKNSEKRSIIQYNLDGSVVNSFESSMDAQRKTGFSNSCIGRACKTSKPYKGYIWKYE